MPVIMSASTLVETVAINCEDFADSFLTCTTCLCPFDSETHTPKLLACSHTVCRSCLERISSLPHVRDTGLVRCPICRENLAVPPGGVAAFPPSFMVNQLIDLMTRQRRDVIPRCASHTSEELLFCETCDVVFCLKCLNGSAHADGSCDHTVVPFAVAIKRVSGILLYKAKQCLRNLLTAADNTTQEMDMLDSNVDGVLEQVNQSFQEVSALLEQRRQAIIKHVRSVRDEKREVLQEQLRIIRQERSKVENECSDLHHQIEVRDITKKINDLNDMLDMTLTLMEPRENAYLRYDCSHTGMAKRLQAAVDNYGVLCVSKTFPPLCVARPETAGVVHLRNSLLLTTVDYHGNVRSDGGDPVEAKLTHVSEFFPDEEKTETISDRFGHFSGQPSPARLKMATSILSNSGSDIFVSMLSDAETSLMSASTLSTLTSGSATLMHDDGALYGDARNSTLRLSGLYNSAPFNNWMHTSASCSGQDARLTIDAASRLKTSFKQGTVVPCSTTDLENGTYRIQYQVGKPGTYELEVRIFGRPIRNSPLTLHVSPHNNPAWIFHGPADRRLNQPVRLSCGPDGQLYILDTGNQRILSYATFDEGRMAVLSGESNIVDLQGQSCTGMTLGCNNSMYIVNWRNCAVSEVSLDFNNPRLLRRFQCSEFKEPIDIAIDTLASRILVGDNAQGRVYVFQLSSAQFMHSFDVRQAVLASLTAKSIGSSSPASSPRLGITPAPDSAPGTPPAIGGVVRTLSRGKSEQRASSSKEQLYCLCVAQNGDVIVGGTRISVFSREGKLKSIINPSDLFAQATATNTKSFTGSLSNPSSPGSSLARSQVTTLSQVAPNSGVFVNGIAVDSAGYLLASVMERHRSYILVYRLYSENGEQERSEASVKYFMIDSFASKLRRPSGLCVSHDGHVFVADLGNHSVRKYRYR